MNVTHKAQATARGLGWFSIGLGIVEIGPGRISGDVGRAGALVRVEDVAFVAEPRGCDAEHAA